MFSFRQKILVTYVIVFLIFVGMTFPFAQRAVKDITLKGMQYRATELITELKGAPDDDALIRRIKDLNSLIFFRVSIITDERKVLYDSHTKRLFGPRFSQEYIVEHPEVLDAFEKGYGYHEEYSSILDRDFAYYAKAFNFHGKVYVLRTAFPLEYVKELTHDFEIGVITVTAAVLLLFSLMTWFIMNHLTTPILRIIDAVRPYQEGKTKAIPEIPMSSENRNDEFGQLAYTLNDMSEKIQDHINSLVEERNDKKMVLDSLVEGVVAVDENMVITFLNPMTSKYLHTKPEKLLGQDFRKIGKPDFCAILEQCQEEKRILTDTVIFKRRGSKIYLDIVAAPKKDGKGAILVIQDKTAQHKLLEMRRDFVANASHELKTPITIIRGFAEALHDNPDLSESTYEEITAKIVNNCKRMSELIKDLLTLSDIEHIPESRIQKCDLLQLVEDIIPIVKDVYPDANIQIDHSENNGFIIMGDPKLLEMAFLNLIANAAKYSNAPAKIIVRLEHQGDWLRVEISDQGIGIPEEDLENIFLRFYRVDKSRSKKMGGTGLGLSIVQTIIDKHFGKISVDSKVDEGTTFSVLLPVQRARQE